MQLKPNITSSHKLQLHISLQVLLYYLTIKILIKVKYVLKYEIYGFEILIN